MRRLGATLRVNIRLISAETGALLWSDWFDEEIGEPGGGPDLIVRRVKDELGVRLIDIESARSRSERPTDPDAFDLVLRVRSIRNQPPSLPRDREVTALLEQALALDPRSVYPMAHIAYYLANATGYLGWQDFAMMQRAEHLLMRARSIAPEEPFVLNAYVLWLRWLAVAPKPSRCASGPSGCIRTEFGDGWASTMSLADARPGWGKRRKVLPSRRRQTGSIPGVLGGISATAISAGIACYRAGIRMPSDTSNDPWQSIRRMMATCIGNTAGLRRPMPAQAISQPRGNTSPGPNGFGRMTRCAVVLLNF